MSSSTVYLVRHGAHDRLGRFLCGRDDTALNAEGQAQAEHLGERFAALEIDAIQTSPQVRAAQTADPIARRLGLPAVVEPALNEIDFGAWTGAAFPDLAPSPGWSAWNTDRGRNRPPGGESMLEVQVRIAGWLDGLRTRALALVAVSHADVIKAAVCHALGLPLQVHDRFEIDPGSVTTLVVGVWGMKLQAMNEGPLG